MTTMKLICVLCLASCAFMLASCTQLSSPTPTPVPPTETPPLETIKPGDKIGDMTLEQGSPALPYPYLWGFCEYAVEGEEPATYETDCNVPQITGMEIVFGWMAKDTKFAANWEAMSWKLSVDGNKVALDEFDWYENVYSQHGDNNIDRHWIIDLKNLSPGEHVLQLSWTSEVEIDDGFKVYQPGTYEHIVNFTVQEKPTYPTFPSATSPGQHPFTSEKAQLDFLLYQPGDYGKDPELKWPMIVYLHGGAYRGVTLDLLRNSPFPKELEQNNDFPFIVVSPQGDGGFEFWTQDKMIDSLFTLLDEIQETYSIDGKRIYLMGDGMGGNGVWELALQRPEYFAALVPVGGYIGYPFSVPENICDLKDVPVWAFHGERDVMVPAEVGQELVDALNACGGSAQITLSSQMNIDILFNVYRDPELYEWLSAQAQR